MDEWRRTVEISKTDEAQNLVFGWLSRVVEPDGSTVVDKQGDIIPPDELEQAAYDFMLKSRASDAMHDGEQIGDVVESFLSTPEKRAAMGAASVDKSVGWWIGVKVSPSVFKRVKAGELRAFSIGGSAVREAVA